MGNRADGLPVAQARNQTPIHQLEDTAFGFDGGIGRLIEHASHLTVALRRSVAVVHLSALVIAWACPHPGRELLRRRKGRRGGPDFSNDLLRGSAARNP